MTAPIFKNRLLASLPLRDQELFVAVPVVPLALKQVLFDEGDPFKYMYFIETGVASILTTLASGGAIEVGMIGNEGIVGVSALLGAKTSGQHAIIQIEGTARRMPVAQCRSAFNQSEAFRSIALRFVESFLSLASQTAACNRLHPIEKRCARWLLMATERGQSNTIPMTHEFLSSMLGVRRAGITDTAGELQRLGLIQYQRGQLTVIDRAGLEAAACECYQADTHRYGWLSQDNVKLA